LNNEVLFYFKADLSFITFVHLFFTVNHCFVGNEIFFLMCASIYNKKKYAKESAKEKKVSREGQKL